jgi:protein-tyrosine phosphatase
MTRELHWDACLNVRDLGGLPTRTGGQIRWGALVRADTLCRLTPAGQRALVAHGVRTVVDLQLPDELSGPHPFGAPDGAPSDAPGGEGPRYLNLALGAGRDPAVSAAIQAARTHVERYRLSVDLNRRALGAVCRAVAVAPAGGVVVHCQAGKDRTGIAVALLLALVGVDDEVIAADYALSYPNLIAQYDRELDADGVTDPEARAALHRARRSDPETMLATLAHVRERHGGPDAYLFTAGLTTEELDLLRARLIG